MSTGLLLLAALLAQQPEPAPNPARERWDALMKSYAGAAALRLRAESVIEDPEADETDALTLRLSVAADLMRPCAGRILLDGEEGDAEEKESIRVLYLGDGAGVWQVDEEAGKAVKEGDAWSGCSAMFFLSYLGESWSGEKVGAEEVAFLPAREDRPGWIGISLTGPDLFGETATATAWLDERGALRSFSLPLGGTAAIVTTIASLELLAKADAKEFLRPLPEGIEKVEIEMPDLEADLLAVGAEAPDVALVGMDDAEFRLSSLRGKTVLLNFWFFH